MKSIFLSNKIKILSNKIKWNIQWIQKVIKHIQYNIELTKLNGSMGPLVPNYHSLEHLLELVLAHSSFFLLHFSFKCGTKNSEVLKFWALNKPNSKLKFGKLVVPMIPGSSPRPWPRLCENLNPSGRLLSQRAWVKALKR